MAELTYRLKQSNRKTISVYVSPDGSIDVLAPNRLSVAEIDQHVQSKAFLIYKHQAAFEELNAPRRAREFVSGESFLYLGRNYLLEFSDRYPRLTLKDGRFFVARKSEAELAQEFEDFYRQKGRKKLAERVGLYAERMGLSVRAIRVMELKSRWASCNALGDVNFHWKCMMLPVKILDYVVVHELCHLVHRGHTEAFWALVDRVLPDWRERKEWLRGNGAGINF